MKRIVEKITHIVVPHEKNGNIPHILKEEFFVFIAIFVGILFCFNQYNFSILRSLNLTATVYPAVLADLTNQDRLAYNASKLTWNNTLEKAAKLKAEDMLKNGYFAHTSPSGVTPWHWLKEVNYNFIYAGENLAVDFTESTNVQKAWLNSPKHRENILNSNFTEIGIATADGFFEGKNTTFVVEFFGKPSESSKIKIIEKSIPTSKITPTNDTKEVSPTVAGAKTENIVSVKVENSEIKVMEESNKFIVVKNEAVLNSEVKEKEILGDTITQNNQKELSTWYTRFLVSPTNTIRIIYIVLLGLILTAVSLVLFKEYKKHQLKHLFLGILLIAIIAVLLYVVSTNKTEFILGFNYV